MGIKVGILFSQRAFSDVALQFASQGFHGLMSYLERMARLREPILIVGGPQVVLCQCPVLREGLTCMDFEGLLVVMDSLLHIVSPLALWILK